MIKGQVPIGSDKQQVKAFIDTFQIGTLTIIRDKEFHEATRQSLGNHDEKKVAALGSRIAEYTGAVILSAYKYDFVTYDDIVITFYIDKDGRMIDYTVKVQSAV